MRGVHKTGFTWFTWFRVFTGYGAGLTAFTWFTWLTRFMGYEVYGGHVVDDVYGLFRVYAVLGGLQVLAFIWIARDAFCKF